MNPPFTRDSLRHDQFSRHEERPSRSERRRSSRDSRTRPPRACTHPHRCGAFTVLGQSLLEDRDRSAGADLADRRANRRTGNLALRRYLAEQLETIVASHDPERIFFSENTSIGEVLLVCRRWTGGPKPPTRVVNLARNPSTPRGSAATSPPGSPGEEIRPRLHRAVARRSGSNGETGTRNFLSPYLVGMYRTLPKSRFFNGRHSVPMSRIGGGWPSRGDVSACVYTRRVPTASWATRALWYHKTDVTRRKRRRRTSTSSPNRLGRHLADRYWEQPHPTPVAAPALAPRGSPQSPTPEPAVGSIWTPCRPHRPGTRGFVPVPQLLGGNRPTRRTRDNRPSYPSFSLDALRSNPRTELR